MIASQAARADSASALHRGGGPGSTSSELRPPRVIHRTPRMPTFAAGAVDVGGLVDALEVEVVGLAGDSATGAGAEGPAGSGEPAQLASVAAMAVSVTTRAGVAVLTRTSRMPHTTGLGPETPSSLTLGGRHTVPLSQLEWRVPLRIAAGGLCAAPHLEAGAPRPLPVVRSAGAEGSLCHLCAAPHLDAGAPRPLPAVRSAGAERSLCHLCAAPHLDAVHDRRHRRDPAARDGGKWATHHLAPWSRRQRGGRWSTSGRIFRTFPRPPRADEGRCLEMWSRGVLRQGVKQRAAASGREAGGLRQGVKQRVVASECGARGCCVRE